MKKLLAIALIASVSFVSCSEGETTEESTVETVDSTMEAKMDSVENRADSVVNVIDSAKDATIDSVKAAN